MSNSDGSNCKVVTTPQDRPMNSVGGAAELDEIRKRSSPQCEKYYVSLEGGRVVKNFKVEEVIYHSMKGDHASLEKWKEERENLVHTMSACPTII